MAQTGSQCVVSSGNILLRGLARADQALLEPHAEAVCAPRGATLFRAEERIDAVYFPGTAVLALHEGAAGDPPVEVGLVGREGLLGWPALLGCERPGHAAVVQMSPAHLLRVAVGPLREACRRSPTLGPALLRFVQVVIAQMARAIASHVRDPLDQRLARWLLMRHDRVGGDVLLAQHDEIAHSLAVRRASVTDRLHVIEGETLIRCKRGRILVRDRAGLEMFAGDAYGGAEAQYRALIAPFGKTVPAPATPGAAADRPAYPARAA